MDRTRYILIDDSERRPPLYHVTAPGASGYMRHEFSLDATRATWFLTRVAARHRLQQLRRLGIVRPGLRIVPIAVTRQDQLDRVLTEAAAAPDAETAAIVRACAAFVPETGRRTA